MPIHSFSSRKARTLWNLWPRSSAVSAWFRWGTSRSKCLTGYSAPPSRGKRRSSTAGRRNRGVMLHQSKIDPDLFMRSPIRRANFSRCGRAGSGVPQLASAAARRTTTTELKGPGSIKSRSSVYRSSPYREADRVWTRPKIRSRNSSLAPLTLTQTRGFDPPRTGPIRAPMFKMGTEGRNAR
jgi:hypothetical protein